MRELRGVRPAAAAAWPARMQPNGRGVPCGRSVAELPEVSDGERPIHVEGYLTDLFTERAVRVVSRPRHKPFFLSLQYNAPHWPWQNPGDPPYPDTLDVTAGGSPETYSRMVRSMDEGIGRVLDGLHQRRLERDTLVVFTSDNGGERFSHMGPFSERKMSLWEGGIRVAAVARWPGVIPAGSRCEQVCATFDLTATAAARPVLAPDAAAQTESAAQRGLEIPHHRQRRRASVRPVD
jgi:arylsulfatase A-like enzyme